jgi:FAD/FMN-containing dehydrogenase
MSVLTSAPLLAELTGILGREALLLPGDAGMQRHLADFLGGSAAADAPMAVARPASTAEVSALMCCCDRHDQPVVVQGGLTGLVAGGRPEQDEVVVSLERMRAIEETDTVAATMTLQAGVPLQAAQAAALAAGMMFPLDMGSRGSCTVGGNVSTNAGGNRVLRYGMARESILGVEAVLADGTICGNLNKMLKNNAGYDVKQLFIGSEGTLGIVTRAVFRLYPAPTSACAALCAVPDYAAAVALLKLARAALGPALSAFELMWPEYYRFATATQVIAAAGGRWRPGRAARPAGHRTRSRQSAIRDPVGRRARHWCCAGQRDREIRARVRTVLGDSRSRGRDDAAVRELSGIRCQHSCQRHRRIRRRLSVATG